MKASVLKLENIKKRYKEKVAVDNISLYIKQGEIVGLLGPNGAGKTTTFKIILGFIKPDNGKVLIDEEEITYLPVYKRALKGLSFLPQEPSIFRDLTVLENLTIFLEFQDLTESQIYEKAEELLKEFDIYHLKNQKVGTLSGGERRRLEIARTLITNPSFLLLDEPFAGVDPISVKEINNLIKAVVERDIGVIITDHNVRETLKTTDRAYIIAHGKVIAEGTPTKIVEDPDVKKIFLGEDFKLS